MKKILSGVAVLAVLVGGIAGGSVAQAASAPAAVPAAASAEPKPPQRDFEWEKAAKAVKAQSWQFRDKGFPDTTGKLKVAKKTTKVESNPEAVAPVPPTGVPIYRLYNIVRENLASTDNGAAFDMTIAKTYLNTGSDHHGILEEAVQDDAGNVVEVGTTVNPQVCPNIATQTGPCVFVFHWEGGNGQCYNVGCGFVPNPNADYAPGDELPNPNNSSGLNFRIVEVDDAWWIGLGVPTSPGYWMGYYPQTEWTDPGTDAVAPFENPTLVQMFTETATTEPVHPTWNMSTPCTDFGNGRLAVSNPTPTALPARMVNVKTLFNGGANSLPATPSWTNSPSTLPTQAGNVVPIPGTTDDFYVGGPGWRGPNTLPGMINGCGS